MNSRVPGGYTGSLMLRQHTYLLYLTDHGMHEGRASPMLSSDVPWWRSASRTTNKQPIAQAI
jgi:hypothetical protein